MNDQFSVVSEMVKKQRESILALAVLDTLSSFNNLKIDYYLPRLQISVPRIDTSVLEDAMQIVQIANSIQSDIERLTEQFKDVFQGLDEVLKRYTADFAAVALAVQNIASFGAFRQFFEITQAEKTTVEAFRAAGWPIAPSMPRELRMRVVQLHRQGKSRYASQSILGYYRRNNFENLYSMVSSWEGHYLFQSRMHIVRDAVDAHVDGKYTLSVPALLPLVEGCLTDYVRSNTLPARLGKIRDVYTAAIGDPMDYGLAEWAIVQTLLYQLQMNIYDFTDFESELERVASRRKANRHTILHGITPKYDKESHSLRVLLLLDAITALRPIREE